jgi:hypothetical protein
MLMALGPDGKLSSPLQLARCPNVDITDGAVMCGYPAAFI